MKIETSRNFTVDEITLKLKGWSGDSQGKAIKKDFEFIDFNSAFGFMTKVAMLAEKINHHPEWSNVYNRISVLLTTHDAQGLTHLDLQMASFMDSISH